MSILYDEGQQAIATESRRVLDARMSKDRLLTLLEQVGEHDRPFWDTAVEQGWTALAIPEEHGGLGLGLTELGLVAQACGAATAGAPFLTFGYGAARALIEGGDAELAARWLPALASGEAHIRADGTPIDFAASEIDTAPVDEAPCGAPLAAGAK